MRGRFLRCYARPIRVTVWQLFDALARMLLADGIAARVTLQGQGRISTKIGNAPACRLASAKLGAEGVGYGEPDP